MRRICSTHMAGAISHDAFSPPRLTSHAMTEIQRADARSWRQGLVVALVVVLIGAILIVAYKQYAPELHAWLGDTPSESRTRFGIVLAAMAALGCVPLLGLAVYLWIFGNRVIRAQRFPLPGSFVVRDTPVLRDRAAIRRGRVFEAFAAAFFVAAFGLLFALWQLWSLLPTQDR